MYETPVYLSIATLSGFRQWLAQQGLCKNTLLAYNMRIAAFVEHERTRTLELEPILSAHAATSYLKSLRVHSSASTCNVTKSALCKLFEFAGIAYLPSIKFDYRDKKEQLLSSEQILQFLQTKDYGHSAKARLIALLCFDADISASDCLNLNRGDVIICSEPNGRDIPAMRVQSSAGSIANTASIEQNASGLVPFSIDYGGARGSIFERCYLLVGRRRQTVEIYGRTKDLLLEWYFGEGQSKEDSAPLFPSEQGTRMSRSGVDYLIKSVGIASRMLLSARLLQNSGKFYRKQMMPQASHQIKQPAVSASSPSLLLASRTAHVLTADVLQVQSEMI